MKKIVKKKSSPTPEGTEAAAEKKRTVRKVSGQTSKSLQKKEEERDSCTPDAATARFVLKFSPSFPKQKFV